MANQKISIKGAIEAILFTLGRSVSIDEIKQILENNNITAKNNAIIKALNDLKSQYETHEGIKIYETNNAWMMSVKDPYTSIIKSLTYEQDLTKSVLETLAIIAWKAPVLQSEVIRLRNTKAYDHINILEQRGFITKEKFGNSYILKLTDKFFDYFDIDSSVDLRKLFKQRLAEFETELKKRNEKKTKKVSDSDKDNKENTKTNMDLEKTMQKHYDSMNQPTSNILETKEATSVEDRKANALTNANQEDFNNLNNQLKNELKNNQINKEESDASVEKDKEDLNQNTNQEVKKSEKIHPLSTNKSDDNIIENDTFELKESEEVKEQNQVNMPNNTENNEDLSNEIIDELEKHGVQVIIDKNKSKKNKAQTKKSKKLPKKSDELIVKDKEIEEIAKELFDDTDEDDSIFNRDVDFDEVIKKYADHVQESDAKEIINDAADVFNIEENTENEKNEEFKSKSNKSDEDLEKEI